jgi:hypothetical protein
MTDFDRFLPQPQVHALRDQGALVGVVVQLQRAKSVRSVQPDLERAVFFELDAHDLPVSITFLEPLGATAICEVIYTLLSGSDGPEGVDRRVEFRVLPPERVAPAVKAIQEAQEQFSGPDEQRALPFARALA